MNLTDEQLEIIKHDYKDNPVLIIDAKSGSGKTSTLFHAFKRNSRMRIIYVVFSKAMKDEAERKFAPLKNVKVMSIYGLAYANEGRKYAKKLIDNYKVHNLVDDLHNNNILKIDLSNSLDRDLAYTMKDIYEGYLMSSEHDFKTYCKSMKLDDYEAVIYDSLSKLIELAKSQKSDVKVTHNFYMKMYAMSNPQIPYDLIAIDECVTGDTWVDTEIGSMSIIALCELYACRGAAPLVKSYNLDSKTYEYKKVLNAIKRELRNVAKVILSNGSEITGTWNHKLLTTNGYSTISELEVGNSMVVLADGLYSKVVDIIDSGVGDVYDIEVEDNHNFVAAKKYSPVGIVSHNCQDLQDIFIGVLEGQKKARIIAVGDQHQQIFSFAGCDNALEKLKTENSRTLTLTNSFRAGHQIGKIATVIYNRFGFNFKMQGVNKNQTLVDYIDPNQPHAVVCRTRAKLFEKAMISIDEEKKIHFVGGFKNYDFQKVMNAFYFFAQGKRPDPMYDNTFVPFTCWREVENLLEEQDKNPRMKVDPELRFLASMVKTYNVKIPHYYNRIRESEVSASEADIVLTTAHKSKGLEFEIPMYIHEDYIDLTKALLGLYETPAKDRHWYLESIKEEMNIWYVALTRAKGKAMLSTQTKDFLRDMKLINSKLVSELVEERKLNDQITKQLQIEAKNIKNETWESVKFKKTR